MTAGPYSIGSAHWPGVSKLIEEMGEIGQVLGKLIATGGETAHWDGTDLRARLNGEIGDLSAALDFFIFANHDRLDVGAITARASEKRTLFWRWHAEQGGAA